MKFLHKTLCTILTASFISISGSNAAPVRYPESMSDRQLLEQLMTDTWSCLDDMIDPETGFPQDTQKPGGHTNTTNLGLYLASLCCAFESGLTSKEHGFERAEKIIASLETYRRMHGFMPHIIEVDLSHKEAHSIMAVSDFNKLAVGLIMVRQTWPELAPRITAFLDTIEWGRLYDEETGKLSWGYNFDTDQPTGQGNLWLTADTRSAVFMMVATEAAPPEIWARMDRLPKETSYGTILRGYGMGGLFLHAMDGLFLPEIDTEVGESAGNLAWQQINLAAQRGYPFWGWSNCYMPGSGYTQGGYLSEQVVTPHAVTLMIEYYPQKVTAVLREMIQRGGTVPPAGYEGKNWGLRDAYNMVSDQWDERYLSLDQGMLFLALANYLHDGMVRTIYAADPLVQNGLKKLQPFIKHDAALLQTWKERDALTLNSNRSSKSEALRSEKLILNVATPEGSPSVIIEAQGNDRHQIRFNAEANAEPILAAFDCKPASLTGMEAIDVDLKLNHSPDTRPGYLRMQLTDRFGQERCAYLELDPSKTTYRIPADQLLGIHLDETAVTGVQFVAWTNPWFYSDKKMMTDRLSFELGEIRIIKSKPEK
jgi:hypothetical protein